MDITRADVAIFISCLALMFTAAHFIWNVRKDRGGIRPRVQVNVVVAKIAAMDKDYGKAIMIRAVNLGPGEVHLTSLPLKSRWRNRGGHGYKWGSVMPDPKAPYGNSLPVSLTVGKEALFLVPYDADSFLSVKHAHVGVGDSFGKNHWAPKKQLRRAEETYEEDFPLGPRDK
jgi:hypothetical protein